jgi:hypothetical protein
MFPLTHRQPGPASLSGGCLLCYAIDALFQVRRSGLPNRAVSGFSISIGV